MPDTDEGFFSARDGVRLFWHTERAASPAGHVALLHGYAEHLGRQNEIMRALADRGYTVHLLDCSPELGLVVGFRNGGHFELHALAAPHLQTGSVRT